MKQFLCLLSIFAFCLDLCAKSVHISSPNRPISVLVDDRDGVITFSINHESKILLSPSNISLDLLDVKRASSIKKVKKNPLVKEIIDAKFYRQAQFTVEYNSAFIYLDNGTAIEVRAYDEGVAYRYVTSYKGDVIVVNETMDLALPADLEVWLPYSTNDDKPMAMAFQNIYDHTTIGRAKDKLAFLPATVAYPSGVKLTITESDLEAYPGMFVKADTVSYRIKGLFAKYPATFDYYPWRVQQYVTSTNDYIAATQGTRTYPWRVFAITEHDTEMPANNLVYALASPCRIDDTSWIHGGKVAWEWWNDWGLTGVDFQSGINMPTYMKYIDFASEYGLQYVVLDEGWYESKGGDMFRPIDSLDIKALVDYAAERNVGIVLWCVFNVLDNRLDEICAHYSRMGVKGFKVDFLDRDDQTAVEMAYRIAEGCAKYHLLLDYHGIYKPTGMNRTYPNVINFESVFGMEEHRWGTLEQDMPQYDVTFPYIRLLAGCVDFTPGAMRNGTRADWQANYYNPVSQGTRCHQAAMYVVYDSPFTMLCDSPSAYEAEPEYTRFIADIPVDVDETRILAGEIGKYIVTARRHGDDWWIGGLSGWDRTQIAITLDILSDGTYTATVLSDGVNASHRAEDYAFTSSVMNNNSTLNIEMAPGGGFVVRLIKQK